MGFPSPQFGVPLAPNQINPELPFYPIYGVTPDDKYIPFSITENGFLNVNATFSGSITIGEVGTPDESNFTFGTSLEQPVGGVYQDTNPTLSPGETGAVRLTEYRAFHVNLRDSSCIEVFPATETTSLSILSTLEQLNFSGGSLVVTTTGTAGVPSNTYVENLAVPSGILTTLYSFVVPSSKTYSLNSFIAWGQYDGNFIVTVDAIRVGGARSSPTSRTITLDYISAPIVVNAGSQILSLIHISEPTRQAEISS